MERKTVRKMVHIPAGVDNGTQIRLAGEGQPGTNGGPQGNLYLEIKVKPHKFFKRREDDVLLNLNINIAQAVLGAEVEVPTVDGNAKLHIPSGTQPGKVFTIKNKGIPHVRANGRGDEMVIVNVETPTKFNLGAKEAVRTACQNAWYRSETSGTQLHRRPEGCLWWLKLTGWKSP